MHQENKTSIKIADGDWHATIDLLHGANCISLRNEKYCAVILREPDYEKGIDNPYLYGMPVLYPVNRISGGSFVFEGRTYTYPVNEPSTGCHIHGKLHESEFTLIDKKENSISCFYEETGEFRITLSYTLTEDGLIHETVIKNLSDVNMPNFLGFHTTFNCLFTEGAKRENIRVLMDTGEEIERNMKVFLPTGKILPPDEITKQLNEGTFNPTGCVLSRHYKIGEKNRIQITDISKKLKIVYENDEKYLFRLIYNGNGDEYVCLEPMTCMANCQNSAFDRDYAGFDWIEAGKEKRYFSSIYLQDEL